MELHSEDGKIKLLKLFKMQKIDQNWQRRCKNRSFLITDKNNSKPCYAKLIVQPLANEKKY